jgi:pimeloyl-ACP methyl ester carboxylesterase
MAISRDVCNSTAARRAVSAIALLAMAVAAAALAATGAGAEIIKKEDMLRGITTTHVQCAATPQTLWLNVDKQDFCVRYYLSTAGGKGTRPVVFLDGDYFGSVNPRTWRSQNPQWIPTSKDKNANVTFDPTITNVDIDTDDLMRTADAFSKMAKTTAIYLARIGVGGTSGNHVLRKTLLELHLMNAALDAIKQSYGFEGFHLAGQSGGSTLVTGLAGMRRDVACAVSGSGPLGTSHDTGSKDPARTLVDPLGFIPSIARNQSLRFIMVTDSADRTVPARQQTPFVEKMRRAGHDIPQYFVTATDEYHHGVVGYAELVTAGCVLGKSDADIATAVGTMVKRNATYNGQRRKEIALFAKNGIASPHPSGGQARAGGKRV